MHPKFKSWLTEQIYALYKKYHHSPDSWMIHSVKVKIVPNKFNWIYSEYNWGDIIHGIK
jgi:hypothetical protein